MPCTYHCACQVAAMNCQRSWCSIWRSTSHGWRCHARGARSCRSCSKHGAFCWGFHGHGCQMGGDYSGKSHLSYFELMIWVISWKIPMKIDDNPRGIPTLGHLQAMGTSVEHQRTGQFFEICFRHEMLFEMFEKVSIWCGKSPLKVILWWCFTLQKMSSNMTGCRSWTCVDPQ